MPRDVTAATTGTTPELFMNVLDAILAEDLGATG